MGRERETRREKGDTARACERQARNWRRTQSSRGDLALHGTNDCSYSHAAPPLRPAAGSLTRQPPCERSTYPPAVVPTGAEGRGRTTWSRPTIFHDRNLILSDVNQRRESERTGRASHLSRINSSSLHVSSLFFSRRSSPLSGSSTRPFIFLSGERPVTIIFTITGVDWTMIDSRETRGFCNPWQRFVPRLQFS